MGPALTAASRGSYPWVAMINHPAAPSDNQRNIVLTGFMGTGKTTVGRILARKLRRGFLDTDAIIEQRHGAITEIFATQGEDAFRAMEQGVAAELGTQKGLVIATGGRLLLDPRNIAALTASGYVYGLSATVGQVYSRINQGAAAAKRPLLAGPDPLGAITTLMGERAPHYRRFAQVAAGTRRADRVAAEIIELHDRTPSLMQSPAGATAVVGVNLFSQLRSMVSPSALHVITTPRLWDRFGPLIGKPDALTLDANTIEETRTGTTVLLGDAALVGNASLRGAAAASGAMAIPSDWAAMQAGTGANTSMIVDLAALQPAQPENQQLWTDWDRVVDHLVNLGWVAAASK